MSDGQAAPVPTAAVTTVRVRVWLPLPHVLEQAENDALHSLTWQSTGQTAGAGLQAVVSCNAGQAAPPALAARVMVRVRVMEPVLPQVTLQAEKADQADTVHSHGVVPHCAVSVSAARSQ